MGLMDRVKAQAQVLAQQTKDAAEQGKARLDQAQAGNRANALLRQLGALVYADRTGRGTPDGQAKIEQLINDLSAHERENGLNLTADPGLPPQSTVPPQPTFPADPPSAYPGGQPVNEYGASPFGGGPAQTSFPDSGSSFPGSDAPSGPESGGTTAFPPEG